MALSPAITEQMARIGATLPGSRSGDSVAALVQEAVWPSGTFARRSGTDGPLICKLRFLPTHSRGQFWDGWERDFAAVDPAQLFPLASDDYYFYFVAANNNDPSDPLLYCVDHEETAAEPHGGRFRTLSELLSVIELNERAE